MRAKSILFILLLFVFSCANNDEETTYQISVDKNQIIFNNSLDAEVAYINIKSNDSWYIEILNPDTILTGDRDWLELKQIKGSGDAVIPITAKPNNSGTERDLLIRIGSYMNGYDVLITVKQIYTFNVLDFVSEGFKTYLTDNIFKDKLIVTKEDAEKITFLDINEDNYKSTYPILMDKDLAYFPNLEELRCKISRGGGGQYYSFKNCPKLTKIDISSSNVSNIDIRENILLKELNCSRNRLSSLDIRNNTNLEKLSCGYNEILTLDLTNCKGLKELDCSSLDISIIDLSSNINLEKLYCNSISSLSLDLSSNLALKELDISDTRLYFTLNSNANLEKLYCSNKGMSSLDVTKYPALKELDCSGNNIKTLNLIANPNLEILNCSQNQISSLDLKNQHFLSKMSCEKNPLVSITKSVKIVGTVYNESELLPNKFSDIYEIIN